MKTGFRIVSLSATPVSDILKLPDLLQNLRCSKLEIRDEDDEDILKYTFEREITEVFIDKENFSDPNVSTFLIDSQEKLPEIVPKLQVLADILAKFFMANGNDLQ